jgi:hypothetical protein
MSTATLTYLIQQTEALTIDEQLRLATYLVARARSIPQPRCGANGVRFLAVCLIL